MKLQLTIGGLRTLKNIDRYRNLPSCQSVCSAALWSMTRCDLTNYRANSRNLCKTWFLLLLAYKIRNFKLQAQMLAQVKSVRSFSLTKIYLFIFNLQLRHRGQNRLNVAYHSRGESGLLSQTSKSAPFTPVKKSWLNTSAAVTVSHHEELVMFLLQRYRVTRCKYIPPKISCWGV